MSNVFNVNSGQECQIHVELISMSITDFTYSQVGLTRPRSWSRHVLTQLPICCQHHLVCLFVWCCINALYGSVGHTGSKTKQSIWVFFAVSLCLFVFFIVCSCSDVTFLKFIPWSCRLFWLMDMAGVSEKRVTPVSVSSTSRLSLHIPFQMRCVSVNECLRFVLTKIWNQLCTFCLFVSSFLSSNFKLIFTSFGKRDGILELTLLRNGCFFSQSVN